MPETDPDHARGRTAQQPPRRGASAAPQELTRADRELIDGVDAAVSGGTQLWRWWQAVDAAGSYARRIELIRTYQQGGNTFAFFDEAPVDGKLLPVMGVVQDVFFDQPRPLPGQERAAALWMRDQIREFALHYYNRVMKLARPQLYPELAEPPLPQALRALSLWPQRGLEVSGFGARQLFYKRRDTGEIGAFPPATQWAIVDQREIGTKYDWVLLQFDFHGFNITLKPFGEEGPQVSLYPSERPYLVMSPEVLTNVDDLGGGLLGSYGPGYSFLSHPQQGIVAYGPDRVEPAFDILQFNVDSQGRTTVRSIFVIPQPTKIFDVPLNPLVWGVGLADALSLGLASRFLQPLRQAVAKLPGGGISFDPAFASIDAANFLTAGWTGRELCLSREMIDLQSLFIHCIEIYEELINALQTWSQVPDWLDRDAIPRWVRTGRFEAVTV